MKPFRAEPVGKAARWVVQSVVETPDQSTLWEPGISTTEYEERLERADLCWAIRASAGRGHGTILARFAMCKDEPDTCQVECAQSALPERLFDTDKLSQLNGEHDTVQDLFTALLSSNGFDPETGFSL
ncbi:MAG: hypothetical protein ACM3XM_18575 [Mycobacterium leprae]